MHSNLLKRLSQYSAAIGIIVIAKNAGAQILYTDINPDFNGEGTIEFYIDLNNDDIYDFHFKQDQESYSDTSSYDGCSWWWDYESSDTLRGYAHSPECALGITGIKVLNFGDEISSDKPWLTNAVMRIHVYSTIGSQTCYGGDHHSFESTKGNWPNETDKYVGVRVLKDDKYYYGWIRLSVDLTTFKVKDYAINLQPDSSVFAGQIDCSTINSYAYPLNGDYTFCEGGTLELAAQYSPEFAESFQWYKDNDIIPNATNTNYTASSSGAFNFTVNYDNQCTDTATVATIISGSPHPSVSISVSNDTLFSNYLAGNQWYKNGNVITGGTNYFFVPAFEGGYQVKVTDSIGCTGTSEVFNFLFNEIQSPNSGLLSYFLQNRLLQIDLHSFKSIGAEVYLSNELGIILQKFSPVSNKFSIDLTEYPDGIYFAIIDFNDRRSIIKFVLTE